jgi:hypothetical protein
LVFILAFFSSEVSMLGIFGSHLVVDKICMCGC